MKMFLALLLSISLTAFAQQNKLSSSQITIPQQTINMPMMFGGVTVNIPIVIPKQTVGLPGNLVVAGTITASELILSGGPALPVCSNNLYVFQLVSGVLQPACLTSTKLSRKKK